MMLLATVGVIGEQYGENRVTVKCDQHDEAQQQVTIGALGHEVKQLSKQEIINEGAENAFEKNNTDIGAMYINPSLQQPIIATSNHSNPVAATTTGIKAPVCEVRSKKYKLTFKQCDAEEAKSNALWNAWIEQAAIK